MTGEPKGPQQAENEGTIEVNQPEKVEGQGTPAVPATPDHGPAIEAQAPQVIAEVSGGISTALLSAVDVENPGKNIPELDPKKLNRSLMFFINRLKGVLPNSRVETVTVQETFLRQVMAEICLVASELKRVMTSPPTAGTPELRVAVRAHIGPEVMEQATSLWREQCSHLADILNGLAQEGPEWMATLDAHDRFAASREALIKISNLHEVMLSAYQIASRWKSPEGVDFTAEWKKKQDVISGIAKEQKFSGLNNEDLADAQIDEEMHQQMQLMMQEQRDPAEIAQWLTHGIKINFQHMGNSLAGQKQFVVHEHLNDVESGDASAPNYYVPTTVGNLFESEAFTLAFYLCIIDRNAKVILASQKLAALIGEGHQGE